jgi:hypothetical protein
MNKFDFLIKDFLIICPEFQEIWSEHLNFWNGEENRGIYNDIAEVARFIVELYKRENNKKVSESFRFIEKLLETDDEEVKEVIIWGLIEDIQNIASHEEFGYTVFEKWLMPNSKIAWNQVKKAWEGKTSLMDVIRAKNRN